MRQFLGQRDPRRDCVVLPILTGSVGNAAYNQNSHSAGHGFEQYSRDDLFCGTKPGMDIVPRVRVQRSPAAMTKVAVQPVVGNLVNGLPSARRIFTERA